MQITVEDLKKILKKYSNDLVIGVSISSRQIGIFDDDFQQERISSDGSLLLLDFGDF